VVSVVLRHEYASKINKCNFKSGEQDPVLYYPIKTFVRTLDCSSTSWRDQLLSNLETKTAGSAQGRDQQFSKFIRAHLLTCI